MSGVVAERLFYAGQTVDIQRTDGRIHEACVSGVNPSNRSVTVEWFEKGETKGKEVEWDSIIQVNPSLLQQSGDDGVEVAPSPSPPKMSVNDRRYPDRRANAAAVGSPHPQANHVKLNVGGGGARTRARVGSKLLRDQTMATDADDVDVDDNENLPLARQQASNLAAAKRKSVTVQEIEKLQKNRDERRAQQEELRKHKETLKNVDPGNPNWEFLAMITEYRDGINFRPLRATDAIEDHRISVCVRKRPLNRKELNRKEVDVLTVPNADHVIVHQPQTKVDLTKYVEHQKFRFDYTFDTSVTNEIVYRFTAQPLVRTVFDQGFATCFAYGQTGSGKTHTMGGDFNGKAQEYAKGVYALTAKDVFKLLNSKDYKKEALVVSCSFFEIYSGKVFDLLNNKLKLRVLEDGKKEVQVVGLEEAVCANEVEVLDIIRRGTEVRTSGTTSANNQSSRSHAVFQIILRRKSQPRKTYGKFSLIDLAGNERGADTMSSDRQTRMEGAEINKSLLALKECIRAMGRNSSHVPFRASKLTLVLRDSFVGANARTCMIAMVSPGLSSCEHTLNTLRYADRVKELGAEDVEGNGGKANDFAMSDSPNPTDSDLALLQSRNEEELTSELLEFQLTVNHLNDAEEVAIDEHARFTDALEAVARDMRRLLQRAERVESDVEAYAKDLKALLARVPDARGLTRATDSLLGLIDEENTVAQAQSQSRKRPAR